MSSYAKWWRELVGRLFTAKKDQSRNELDKKLVFGLLKKRIPSFKQVKYLPRFLSPRELWILRGAFLVLLAGVIWWGAHWWLYGLKQYPQAGGVYTEGLVGQPRLVNPILAPLNATDYDISRLIFRGLLQYGNDSQLHPDLAESYEISGDGKAYTIYLRRDVVWQDSEQFDADDVLFTVAAIKNPYLQSPMLSSFYGVTAEKLDPYTVKFTLAEAYAPFLSVLTCGILPEHIWNKIPDNQFSLAEYNLKPIGNGPFKFKSLVKDKMGFIKSYTLERNSNYSGQTAYLDDISFKFFTSPEEAAVALKSRNIDGLLCSASDWQEKIGSPRSLKQQKIHLPQYTALFFNQTKNTALANYNVRAALTLATNRQEIIDQVLNGDGEMIQGPITRGTLGYNDKLEPYEYNVEKAKTLLDKQGWKINTDDNLRYKSGQALTITLTTVGTAEYLKAAEIIKQNWERLNLKVEVRPLPAESFQRDILRPHDYEILLYSVISGFDPDPYPIWHSSQIDNGLNLALYRNKKVDVLLSDARGETSYEKRGAKYREAQTLIQNDLPAIFLYNPTHIYFFDKRLRGSDFTNLSTPQDRFNGAQAWYLKVKRSLK